MIAPQLGLAQAKCQVLPTKNEQLCKEALNRADNLISKQHDLVLKLQVQSTDLTDENEKLSKSIQALRQVKSRTFNDEITIGLVGVVAGIVIALLARPKL